MAQSHRARVEGDTGELVSRRTYTMAEVSKILGVSTALVYKQAQAGGLPGIVRLGDRLLVNRIALDRFAAGEGGARTGENRTSRAA